jgi:hypothetical protein
MENQCRIQKKYRIFQRMLNHLMLLKDSRYLNDKITDKSSKSVLVGDICTTRQDVYRISDFLRSFKTDFEQVYLTNLQFWVIICDYSWALMRSIVEALNNQLMEDYAVKVWK